MTELSEADLIMINGTPWPLSVWTSTSLTVEMKNKLVRKYKNNSFLPEFNKEKNWFDIK